MNGAPEQTNLPAQIANAVAGVPAALVPACVKALDRLIGAAVDIPVAWLEQRKARIEAQTQAIGLVEGAIAGAVAAQVGADDATVRNALNVLVNKEYRKQINREAVAVAMVEDLRKEAPQVAAGEAAASPPPLDEDWLNVFERYAEDASSERMQNLWGRVLAGEVRKPGRYSTRTLRFLSEFSRSDGLLFSEFSKSAFCDFAPTSLIKPNHNADISKLIALESSGLLHGSSGLGLSRSVTFDDKGYIRLREGSLIILFKGNPGEKVDFECVVLTDLGKELLDLVLDRDAVAAARAVANAIKKPLLKQATLFRIIAEGQTPVFVESFWVEEAKPA